MKVRLVPPVAADGKRYSSLTLGAEYEVLGIEGDWLRLLNDRGEPVLYDTACFEITDSTEPEDWGSVDEDGVRYAYPPVWGCPGFFEDWHDGVPEVREQFSTAIAQRSASRPKQS
ncbi:MAG: hypothetical protein C0467_09880 [Planctomycetaceae bacterium]|nr:hypothetical protein [Planctomycetaceae bacterium]